MIDTTIEHEHPDRLTNEKRSDGFIRNRWFHALSLADQLRKKTEANKNDQLKRFAFHIPPLDSKTKLLIKSVKNQSDLVDSFQKELLFTGGEKFELCDLSEKFFDLQRSFNRMLELETSDVEQLKLSTSITRTALLIVLRSIETTVEIFTKGNRLFPSLSSLIGYVRSREVELPIHGQLLLSWYEAAKTLDLLVNDVDWFVSPRKAHWAMEVCHDTLAWCRAVFHQSMGSLAVCKAIFDRDDSLIFPELEEKN